MKQLSRLDAELALIRRVAHACQDARLDAFVRTLDSASVESRLSDRSLLRFRRSGAACRGEGQLQKISGNWKILDSDGTCLDLLLFADAAGDILEMEFIRYEGGALIEPVWDTLQRVPPSGNLPMARAGSRKRS